MKILTFNLRHNNDHWDARRPLCIDLIDQLQPDIIGFQEVWMPLAQADLIMESVSGAPYTVFNSAKQGHHGTEGIAIATRYPARNFETLELPGGERVAQRITLTVDDRDICFANTHLHHRPLFNETERLPQMQALVEWLSPFDLPTIVTGDMNAVPESETIQFAKTHFVSAYEQVHGQEPDYTYPAPIVGDTYDRGPDVIDYVFITADRLQATAGVIVGDEASGHDPVLSPSDHLGVLVALALN